MVKNKKAYWTGIVLLVVVCAVVYFFFLRPSHTGETVEEAPPAETATATAVPEENIEPIDVDLNASDELVRKLAAGLSSNPLLTRWLVTDSLIRKFVTAVDLISKGESPRRPMNFIEPPVEFPVRREGEKIFADPAGYARYNRIAALITSLDAKGCATLYRQLHRPIEQAYAEMGYPGKDFDAVLDKAIDQLLQTPVVEGRIYLEKGVLTYVYADPDLENLNAAQKHLLRMGPDNVQAIQGKLREIAQYLRFPIQEPE